VTVLEAFMHCGDGHTLVTGPAVSDLHAWWRSSRKMVVKKSSSVDYLE
jgi:hypothetical protein